LIAEACEVKKLGECLLGIALDGDEDEHIRAMAVSALSRCGSDDLIKQLRPLVTAEIAQDSQDEIRGSALKLLWPQHLTAAELFAALQPKQRPEFHGSYSAFMAYLTKSSWQRSSCPANMSLSGNTWLKLSSNGFGPTISARMNSTRRSSKRCFERAPSNVGY
jgi:hypothetical protein